MPVPKLNAHRPIQDIAAYEREMIREAGALIIERAECDRCGGSVPVGSLTHGRCVSCRFMLGGPKL